MVLELLRAFVGSVFPVERFGPNPARHPTDDGVFGVDAVGKEEAEVGPERIDVHAPAQVVLHVSEAIGQGEGQLRDRVGSRLCDVVAADGDRVEVPDALVDEVGLDVAHQTERELRGEDAGVLGLVFLEDVGLHGAANLGQGLGSQLGVGGLVQDFVAGASEEQEAEAIIAVGQVPTVDRAGESMVVPAGLQHLFDVGFEAVFADVLLAPLVNGGVEEKGQHHRRRSIDGHRHTGGRVAQVEPAVQALGVIE